MDVGPSFVFDDWTGRPNHGDYEILTAGKYKRTLTMFGENTEEGREKFKADLEELANSHPDLKVGTTSQTDLIYEELENLRQDLKYCESIEDYASASKLLIQIEKYKKKYKL